MPRHVRNFWIEADIDGRKNVVKTGPNQKDGGFSLRLRMREAGEISDKVIYLHGTAREDGTLTVSCEFPPGAILTQDPTGQHLRLSTQRDRAIRR